MCPGEFKSEESRDCWVLMKCEFSPLRRHKDDCHPLHPSSLLQVWNSEQTRTLFFYLWQSVFLSMKGAGYFQKALENCQKEVFCCINDICLKATPRKGQSSLTSFTFSRKFLWVSRTFPAPPSLPVQDPSAFLGTMEFSWQNRRCPL